MYSPNNALSNPNYDKLDPTLEQIQNVAIRMDATEKALLVQRLQGVLDQLLAWMRQDPAFFLVFSRLGYTGSYYDGVRIGEATEFDLNIILKPKFKMEITKGYCEPGNVTLKMVQGQPARVTDPFTSLWCENGFVKPYKIKRWMESVVSKTLHRFGNHIHGCEVEVFKSGPAITLTVNSNMYPSKEISIDLVPVFEFPSSQWPPGVNRKSKKIMNGSYDFPWCAVPKAQDSWRLSFPLQERYIINDLNFLKYTLRMLKQVRDKLNIDKVASYYIKTLFLIELENNGPEMWSRYRRGRLFMHMLVRFQHALEDEVIPFFWDPRYNLLGWISRDYLRNSAGKLRNFIKTIDQLVNTEASLHSLQEIDAYLKSKLLTSPQEIQEAQCIEEEQQSWCTLM